MADPAREAAGCPESAGLRGCGSEESRWHSGAVSARTRAALGGRRPAGTLTPRTGRHALSRIHAGRRAALAREEPLATRAVLELTHGADSGSVVVCLLRKTAPRPLQSQQNHGAPSSENSTAGQGASRAALPGRVRRHPTLWHRSRDFRHRFPDRDRAVTRGRHRAPRWPWLRATPQIPALYAARRNHNPSVGLREQADSDVPISILGASQAPGCGCELEIRTVGRVPRRPRQRDRQRVRRGRAEPPPA